MCLVSLSLDNFNCCRLINLLLNVVAIYIYIIFGCWIDKISPPYLFYSTLTRGYFGLNHWASRVIWLLITTIHHNNVQIGKPKNVLCCILIREFGHKKFYIMFTSKSINRHDFPFSLNFFTINKWLPIFHYRKLISIFLLVDVIEK